MAMIRIFGAVSHARGYVFSECGRQVIYLVSIAVALWFLFPFGLEGVALAAVFGMVTRYLFLAQLALELVEVQWRQFFIAQVPGIVLGIAVAVPAYIASTAGSTFIESDVVLLVVVVAVSMVSLLLSFFLFPISWFGDLYPWLFDRFGSSLPQWLHCRVVIRLSALECDEVKDGLEAKS
jgi:hypothetical protein